MGAMDPGRRAKPVKDKPKVNPFLRDAVKGKGKPFVRSKMDQAKGFRVNSAKGAPMVKTLANSGAKGASGAPMVRTPMGKR